MSILSRFLSSFQARANEIVTDFDDPKASLDYSLTRLIEVRNQVNRSLIDVYSAYKRMEDQRSSLALAYEKYQTQAQMAVNAGREDLARIALERKQEAGSRLVELDASLDSLQQQLETLKTSQADLERKIALFQAKKEELKAVYDASVAQVRVREAVSGLSQDITDIGNTIQRAEQRIREMQARAEAMETLASQGFLTDGLIPNRDDVDRELSRINRVQAVNEELARLKSGINPSLPDHGITKEPPPHLESGSQQ